MKGCCSHTICWTRSNFSFRCLSVGAVACPRISSSISASHCVAGVFWPGFHWWFSPELNQTVIWLFGSRSVFTRPSKHVSFEAKSRLSQEAQRTLRVVPRIRKSSVEPEMIRRRDRTVGRFRKTGVYNSTEICAVDRGRNRLSKFRGAKPCLFIFGQRSCGRLVEPQFFAVEPRTRVPCYC